MSTTVQDGFVNYCTGMQVQALQRYILPAIREWLQSHKGVSVTDEELTGALKIEATPSFTMSMPPNNSLIPNPVAPAKAGRHRVGTTSAAAVPAVPDMSGGCIRIFERKSVKHAKGDKCGMPKHNGTDYCKACLRSKGVSEAVGKTSMSAAATGLTVLDPLAEERNGSSSSFSNGSISLQTDLTLIQGYHVEVNTGIVMNNVNNNWIAYAVYDKNTKTIRQLGQTELQYAQNTHIVVCNNPVESAEHLVKIEAALKSKSFPMPAVLPQSTSVIPPMFSMPTAPIGVAQSLGVQPPIISALQNNQMSALPSVSLPGVTMPSVQNISALPSVSLPGVAMPAGITMPQFNPASLPQFNPASLPQFTPNAGFTFPK
jgi:hypothetical protein